MRLLIVGVNEPGHTGRYLASAAKRLGIDYHIVDTRRAEAASRVGRSFHWHLRGKKPARLDEFAMQVLKMCAVMRPHVTLATGCAPLDQWHIENLRGQGIRVVNFSTDDPWNPSLRARWFISVLPSYDAIFTPR